MNKNWNPEAHVQKMMPYAKKLIKTLKSKGIETDLETENMSNVILTQGNKVKRVSFHSFFRFSGISHIMQEKKKEVHYIEVTDDMFMNGYLPNFLFMLFEDKKDGGQVQTPKTESTESPKEKEGV